MNTKTRHRPNKRISTQGDDETRAAAAEIAAAARHVAQAGKAGTRDIDAALEDPDTIPMLTDILGSEPAAESPAIDKVPQEPMPAVVAKKTPDRFDWTEENWNQMALLVQKNVMKGMTRRTDELINGELRDQLDEILDRGTERLLADIKNTLQQAISEAVAAAIAEEMSQARHQAHASMAKQEKNV